MKLLQIGLMLASTWFLILPTQAAQIMLSGPNVIGGSGQWSMGNYDDAGTFDAFNVVDQQTGAISEPTAGGYWLGRENTGTITGFLNEYFVLDLGAAYFVDQIDLFNTHNNGANDRGTKNFTILGSNAVTLVNADVDYDLSGSSTLLTGTLAFQTQANDPIEAQSYTSGNGLATGTAYRYLKFVANDFHTPKGPGFPQGSGLNEIRLFGTPEPSRAILALLGIAGLTMRRRRS